MERTVVDVLLVILVSIAAYTDIKRGRVYNALTFPAMALGLILNGAFWRTDGLVQSVGAGALAFALLLVPVLLKGVGAGDLKLLVAVGMLEGVPFLLPTFLYSALVIGGASAAVLGCRRLAFIALPMNLPLNLPSNLQLGLGRVKALPFAVAVAIGCLLALYVR